MSLIRDNYHLSGVPQHLNIGFRLQQISLGGGGGGDGESTSHVRTVATYDFDVNGGAVGTHALALSNIIPLGAVLHSIVVDTTVDVLGASGCKMSLGAEAPGDVLALRNVTSAPWEAGLHGNAMSQLYYNPVRAASALSSVDLVIDTAAASAGYVKFVLYYDTYAEDA
jgi:hypothetical protein